jgi:hypothetical protein
MKKYRVKITGKALVDMEVVYDYIAYNLQSPDTAMKQYNRIAAAIESFVLSWNGASCSIQSWSAVMACGNCWWTTTLPFMWSANRKLSF